MKTQELSLPLRCPECNALIVDRRFANCTTCHEPLPVGWLLTSDQIHQLEVIDQHAKAEHAAALQLIEPPGPVGVP